MPKALTYEVPNNNSTMPIVYYAQGNTAGGGAWAEVPFGGRNIAYSGCSVTSLAMVLSYLKLLLITPDSVVRTIAEHNNGNYNAFYVPDSGQSWSIMSAVASYYGLVCKELTVDKVLWELKLNHPIIMSCVPGEFTGKGHFIVLTGTAGPDSEIIRVNDPNGGHAEKSYIGYTINDIRKNGKAWWSFYSNLDPLGLTLPTGTNRTTVHYSSGGVEHGGAGRTIGGMTTLETGLGYSGEPQIVTKDIIKYTVDVEYETISKEVTIDTILTAEENNHTKISNLLSFPAWVETPYILLRVGEVTFGTYAKFESNKFNGKITYPSFITDLSVNKINGLINQYSIRLVYLVLPGDDPNLLDKIFSKVGYGKVYVEYGDLASPSLIYREEECIITKLSTQVDFGSNRISYELKCTSTCVGLTAGFYDFEATDALPSLRILELLNTERYGLLEAFTGMRDSTKWQSLIPTDDAIVHIESKHGIDIISYVNYLVTCMTPNGYENEVIRNATYYMTIYDDVFKDNANGGPYFKITKVEATSRTIGQPDTYELDIGYPSQNQVMQFSVKTDNSWALLYDYQELIDLPTYTYAIDDSGIIKSLYSESLLTNQTLNKMTESRKNWWTRMTLFPIEAEVTIKGLVRPAMLMTYVKVNALFYGQRHVTSGLYVITKQVDTVSGNGFRTTLSLLRIAGDDDYIQKTTTTVESVIPKEVHVNKVIETIEKEVYPDVGYIASIGNYDFVNPVLGAGYGWTYLDYELASFPTINTNNFKTYSLTETELILLAATCIAEQGSEIENVKFYASFIANRYEYMCTLSKLYIEAGIVGLILKGPSYDYATRTANAAKAAANARLDEPFLFNNGKGKYETMTVTREQYNECYKVFVLGNRTHDYNNHDNVGDIIKVVNADGKIYVKPFSENLLKSILVPNYSVIYNKQDTHYVFKTYPPKGGDPFGIEQ